MAHEGFTNYATYIVSDRFGEDNDDPDFLGKSGDFFKQYIIDEICYRTYRDSLAKDYAFEFIEHVDWEQIAKFHNDVWTKFLADNPDYVFEE